MSSENARRKATTGVSSSLSAATSSMAGEKAQREIDDFNEAVAFVEANTAVPYPGDLWEYTKDGTVLCKLVNHFQAGIVRKVNKPGMPFKEMENLTMYSNACKTLGCGSNTFRPPDLYEKRSSYPKAIVRNILALQRATGRSGSSPSPAARPAAAASSPAASPKKSSSSPKKTYAYQSATPAVPSNSTGSQSVSVNLSTFSNSSPAASPSRTTAHSPAADPAHSHGSYNAQTETDRRRAAAAASSSVAGAPDWVKAAKSEQEQNDMLAAQRWMEAVTEESFVNGDLWETTKSGVYLCKLINKIKPGTVKKYSKMSTNLPFKCMENINMFIEGCKQLGMRPGNTFRSPDLFEKRVSYPKAIVNCIHGLARIAQDLPGYKGPTLTVEIASGNSL